MSKYNKLIPVVVGLILAGLNTYFDMSEVVAMESEISNLIIMVLTAIATERMPANT